VRFLWTVEWHCGGVELWICLQNTPKSAKGHRWGESDGVQVVNRILSAPRQKVELGHGYSEERSSVLTKIDEELEDV